MMRHREVYSLAQGHTASKKDWDPAALTPEFILLITILCLLK